jgi:hypothetical protein
MERYFNHNIMEFSSQSYDSVMGSEDAVYWSKLESPKGFRSHSFSVLYQAFDFPFPSIHIPSQSDDVLDPQFSVGCTHGSGSLITSIDMSIDRCVDEVKDSTSSELPLMVSPKEDIDFMTPTASHLIEDVYEPEFECDTVAPKSSGRVTRAQAGAQSPSQVSTIKTRQSANSVSQQSHSIGTKEPNPVEFRSGYRGVSWNRRMKAWLAFWSEGKNRRSKTFNAKVMGFDKARASAIDFLKKKKQFLQQLDPSYTDSCDEDEYIESGSLADSATTTSDTPTGSVIDYCSVCGMGNVSPGDLNSGSHHLVSECSRCHGVMTVSTKTVLSSDDYGLCDEEVIYS